MNDSSDNNKSDLLQDPITASRDPRFLRYQAILKNIRLIFRARQKHAQGVMKECGLSSAQLWMMWELSKSPGLRVSELAKILSIHTSTCSNMLDKIQKKGLARRDRSESDQRNVHLYLTEVGEDLLAKAPQPAQGVLTDVLLKLADEDLTHLEIGLQSLVEELHVANKEDSLQLLDDYYTAE
jgi:DNA-binding MarR family transcriptional regulator